ncbi:MAG TPA: cysteine hydrolase [Actinospica sp.]|nr:cysteine hydrolase [Actinospica sp.]
MTVSTIDPQSALVVIDLQKGIAARPLAHPIEAVAGNSARLAAAFRERELPVVLVNVTGGAPGRTESPRHRGELPPEYAELLPELDVQPGDVLVTKTTWGAFTNTSLHETLQGLGVTQVVLTGVATQIGVESTARSAFEHGYHVVLVTDAMTSTDTVAHDHSIEHIFPRLGETGTTDEVLWLLDSAG